MNFTKGEKAALLQPGTKGVLTEMTPELREKLSRTCAQLVDLLKANTASPAEAYTVLKFTMQWFEQTYGITGLIVIENDEVKNS